MEEMIKDAELGQPAPEEETFSQENRDTIPEDTNIEPIIEVKFNKETKKLTLDEARTLAQKGMKLDLISEELEILQSLSKEKGIGLKEFVKRLESEKRAERLEALREKYRDDAGLLEFLDSFGEVGESDEMSEIRTEFPDLSEEALPQEVKTAAQISGRGLLFEYLLYEHKRHIAEKNEAARQEMTRNSSLGSISMGGQNNTADAEFLRGVWG